MNSFEKAGAYLTLPQTCDLMKHAQSLLFAF